MTFSAPLRASALLALLSACAETTADTSAFDLLDLTGAPIFGVVPTAPEEEEEEPEVTPPVEEEEEEEPEVTPPPVVVPPPVVTPPEVVGINHPIPFNDLRDDAAALSGQIGALGLTPAPQLPTFGEVTYRGYMTVLEADTPAGLSTGAYTYAALGDLSLQADFTRKSLSGTGNNFYEVSNPLARSVSQYQSAGGIAGTLNVSGSTPGDFGINAGFGRVAGTLTKLSGAQSTYNMNLTSFLVGPTGDSIVGLAEGERSASALAASR